MLAIAGLEAESTCVKVTNSLRILQFIVKIAFIWVLFIDSFKAHMTTWQTAQMLLAIPFFVWYEFWRLIGQWKKIKSYHLQYTYTFFDITAVAIIKTLYVDLRSLTLLNKNLGSLYKDISYVYAGYLIVPTVIFVVWLLVYCKMRSAAAKSGLPMAANVVETMTITVIAIQQMWYRILVYINVFGAMVIALASIWANINFLIEFGLDGNIIFFLAFLFELLDIPFNLVEDRILCSEKKKNPAAMILADPVVPGFEIWNCPCCQPKPETAFEGASSSLIP